MAFPHSNDSASSIYGNISADTPASNIYGTTPAAHSSDVGVGIANSPMGAAATAINGNADTAPIKSEDDKRHAANLIEAMEREIGQLSQKAAQNLPRVSTLMSANELEKVRADVAKIRDDLVAEKNAETAKEIVGSLVGAAAVGAGATMAMNNSATPLAPFAMAESPSKDKSADKAANADLPINKEFERLLAGLSRPVMAQGVSDAQHTEMASLGGLGFDKSLPDLKVAERAAEVGNSGRVRSLAS